MHDRLTELAIIHGSDKFGMHDYTPNYYDILKGLEHSEFNLMEIGVGGYGRKYEGGYSLKMWRDFFHKADITGIDIQEKVLDLGARIETFLGSQVDLEFLQDLLESRGPFQIMLDDGSHINEHVVQSFDYLYEHLLPSGFYIAEDLQTAFYPIRGGSLEGTQPNSVFYFADIQQNIRDRSDILNVRRFHNIVSIEKPSAEHKADLKSDLTHLMRRFQGQSAKALMIGLTQDHADAIADAIEENQVDLSAFTTTSTATMEAIANHDIDLVFVVGHTDQNIAILTKTLASLRDGAMWIYLDPKGEIAPDLSAHLHRLFVNIDHLEMVNKFPDAETLAGAERAYEMSTYHTLTNVVVGPNNFPSNANYTGDHEVVKAYVQRSLEVIDRVTDGYALFSLEHFYKQAGREDLRARAVDRVDITDIFGSSHYVQKLNDNTGRYSSDQKVALIERGLKLQPKNTSFIINAGQFYRSEERFEDAVVLFNLALELDPTHNSALTLLAQTYLQLGDLEKAEDAARSCQKNAPEVIAPYSILARVYRESKGTINILPLFEIGSEFLGDNPAFVALYERIKA